MGMLVGLQTSPLCKMTSLPCDKVRYSPVVELYGCWAGEYEEKTEGEREIQPGDIVSDRFFFRERVPYRLRAKADNGP